MFVNKRQIGWGVLFLLFMGFVSGSEVLVFSSGLDGKAVVDERFMVTEGRPIVPGNENDSNVVALLYDNFSELSVWRFDVARQIIVEFEGLVNLTNVSLFFKIPIQDGAQLLFIGGDEITPKIISLRRLCDGDGVCEVGESEARCPFDCGNIMESLARALPESGGEELSKDSEKVDDTSATDMKFVSVLVLVLLAGILFFKFRSRGS